MQANTASNEPVANPTPVMSGSGQRTSEKSTALVGVSPTKQTRVALAFEGGGFPAGAFGAGVIKGLVEKGIFGPFPGAPVRNYDVVAFSGTSAGALLATLCWAHVVKCISDPDLTKERAERRNIDLIAVAVRHASYYECGNNFAWFPVPNAKFARALTSLDADWREKFPLFDAFRQLICAPWFHMLTRDWMRASLAAMMHPEEDPVDWIFTSADELVEAWSPILDHLPSMPLIDVFLKPDAFYKTYQSWLPSVPQLYSGLRAACCADLLAYNLRRVRHGDPVSEVQYLATTLKQKQATLPRLVVGSSNIFRGEDKNFSEEDFLNDGLGAIVASGSLDEVNGWTIIKSGKNQGIYLDGAWGSNPPLSELFDEAHELDEIWIIEFFPKYHGAIPSTPLQRQERRDQLWQNSLVEHETEEVYRKAEALNEKLMQKGSTKTVKVVVHRITHNFPTEPKSTVVNSPQFIGEMMNYGYAAACCFADNH